MKKGKASWRSSSAAVVGRASVPDTTAVTQDDLSKQGNQTDDNRERSRLHRLSYSSTTQSFNTRHYS